MIWQKQFVRISCLVGVLMIAQTTNPLGPGDVMGIIFIVASIFGGGACAMFRQRQQLAEFLLALAQRPVEPVISSLSCTRPVSMK